MDKNYIREQVVNITCALIDIPTENRPPNGDELQGQLYIKSCLEELGIEVTTVSPYDVKDFNINPAFLHEREYENRYNVLGRWKGSQAGQSKSLLLSGHIDVAPKEPLPWLVTEPFKSLIKDGRIYGRGSSDMKGGLACALAAIKLLKEEGFVPKGDIIFESVVDEEYAGATGTIASRILGYNTDFGILLEPTGMAICPACVGGLVLRLTAQGIAGMPFTGEEIRNPAYDIADVIVRLRQFAVQREEKMELPTLWEKTPQKPQIVILKVKAGEVENHGQLSIPIDAWIEFVVQTLPNEDIEQTIKEIMSYIKDVGDIKLERLYHYCKSAAPKQDEKAINLLKECLVGVSGKADIYGAMFSCDLFAFEEFGNMPTVIFGPIGGRLHAPDEWVDIDSQVETVQTLMGFIKQWCG